MEPDLLIHKPDTTVLDEFLFDLKDENNYYRQRAKLLFLTGEITTESTFQDMWRLEKEKYQ